MIENAVSYYLNLINVQGVDPERAAAHARQRFGVSEGDLRERIAGRVADPEATRKALAAIRARLVHDSDAESDEALLWMIYEAVTGEALPTEYLSEPGAPGNDDPDERHGYDA